MARIKLDPANPPQLAPAERARLDAMTDDEITGAAEADPDNPLLSRRERSSLAVRALVTQARQRTGLTQAQFAETFRIGLSRLRDLEQGRYGKAPDTAVEAYIRVIAADPDGVRRALGVQDASPGPASARSATLLAANRRERP